MRIDKHQPQELGSTSFKPFSRLVLTTCSMSPDSACKPVGAEPRVIRSSIFVALVLCNVGVRNSPSTLGQRIRSIGLRDAYIDFIVEVILLSCLLYSCLLPSSLKHIALQPGLLSCQAKKHVYSGRMYRTGGRWWPRRFIYSCSAGT